MRGTMDQDRRNRLFHIIIERLDQDDLRTLVFQMDMGTLDDLAGDTFKAKATSFIDRISRLRREDDIVALLHSMRPDLDLTTLKDGHTQKRPEPFFDREQELKSLSPDRLRVNPGLYTILTGPAQYGKTCLLKHIRNQINDAGNGWKCCYIDFMEGLTDVQAYIFNALIQEKPSDDPPNFLEGILKALQTLACPRPGVKPSALLLLFDSVELLDANQCRNLHKLLAQLRERTQPGTYEILTVRTIIAGRNLDALCPSPGPPSRYRIKPQHVKISPFSPDIIQDMIQLIAFAPHHVQDAVLSPGTDMHTIAPYISEIVDEILYLSDGHPAIINDLVSHLADRGFLVGNFSNYFEVNRPELVAQYITPLARTLLKDTPEPYNQVRNVLSVFRRVNANTIIALVEEGFLPRELDPVEVLGNLQRDYLWDAPEIHEPFYRDNYTRHVLAFDLAYRCEPLAFRAINELACRLYAKWIRDLEPNLAFRQDAQRLLSILEWLYHTLMKKDVDVHIIQQELMEFFMALSSERGLTLPEVHAVLDALWRDKEIVYLAKRQLGNTALRSICAEIEAAYET